MVRIYAVLFLLCSPIPLRGQQTASVESLRFDPHQVDRSRMAIAQRAKLAVNFRHQIFGNVVFELVRISPKRCKKPGNRHTLQANAFDVRPGGSASKVRFGRHFALNFHNPRLLPRHVVFGIQEMQRRKKSGERQFHARSQETTAPFLVIALWESVHVMGNTINKVAGFLGRLQKPRGVEEGVSVCRGVESVPVARERAGFWYKAKEFAMARRHKTLLCVDDNQSGLNICKIILEDFGYKVSTASSAREGLEIFASNVIDAVILDYQMPEMNGELVAAEMRLTKPRVPILMLSGCVSLPETALQLVDGYVAKGDPVEFMLLAIHEVLSRGKERKPVRAVQSRVASYDSETRIV
jgi:CheY-like chemotaxis protein